MKSLLVSVCFVVSAVWITSFAPQGVEAACPPVAASCPVGIADSDPVGSPARECSGHGTCFFGACRCNTGFADLDCGATFRRTKIASAFISQGGFDDGPTRYFDIITQVVELLRKEGNFSIPAQKILTGCRTAIVQTPDVLLEKVNITLIDNSINVQIINGGIQTGGRMHMVIPKVPLDAAIALPPLLGQCCDNSNRVLQQSTLGCAVPCASSKNAQVAFDMDVIFSAQIFPTFDADGRITVNVPADQIKVKFDPPDMGFKLNCNLGAFPDQLLSFIDRFIVSFGEIVSGQVLVKVKEIATDFSQTFSVIGTRLNITQDTSVTVFVPFGEFVQGSHMTVEVEALFQKDRFFGKPNCPSVVTTFVDRSIGAASAPAPNSLSNFFTATDSGTPLRTLFAGRLARSSILVGLNAIMQDNAALISTLTQIKADFGLLDAKFQGSLNVGLPELGFPARSSRAELGNGDFLEAAIPSGSVELLCNITGESLFASQFERGSINLRPLLLGQLEDFQNAFTGDADANFKATLQVFDLDVTQLNLTISDPIQIAIPPALATGVTDKFLGGSKMDAANDLLKKFALPIPPELNRLAPGPRVESLHDTDVPGSDGRNGFFQFSTRCLCDKPLPPPGSSFDKKDLFFVVDSPKFGQEIIPRCLTACPTSSSSVRGLREQDHANSMGGPIAVYPATEYFAAKQSQQDKRSLQTSGLNSSDYIATGRCGADLTFLKTITKGILTCAEKEDAPSLAPLTVKAECLQELVTLSTSDPLLQSSTSPCDRSNPVFSQIVTCEAPVNVLMQDLFGQVCIEGPGFSCTDSISKVLADSCACASDSSSSQCSSTLTPFLILAAGWAIPISTMIIFGIGLRFFEGCCLSRFVGSEEDQLVSFFKVKLSRQDKYFVGLALLNVVSLAILSVGWVFEDPFRVFLEEILQEDLFKQTAWVTTTFDTFALGWSLAIMFAFAFAGSCFLSMTLYSVSVGRCAWLSTVSNQAYVRGGSDEWFVPSERTASVWTRNAMRLQWLNRFAAFLLVSTIFAPPVFFEVRRSIIVQRPQFDPFIDAPGNSPQDLIIGNLTSLATSEETLDLIGQGLGLTLMSSFMGFLSSVVLLIIQGAVPAAFCTASVALYWIDAQQKEELDIWNQTAKQQQRDGMITLPPNGSDRNRWKRTLHFFTWCAHSGGAFGSLIGAILVYQTLRAPPAWAFIWMFSWIITLPAVFSIVRSGGRAMSGRRRLLIAVAYSLGFFASSITLVSLAPSRVSFASPFSIVFLVTFFLYTFLLLISEYCNLGSASTAAVLGAGRAAKRESTKSASAHRQIGGGADGGFEVGYSFQQPMMPSNLSGNIKASAWDQPTAPRIKSVVAVNKVGSAKRGQFAFEERDFGASQQDSVNPSFAYGSSSVGGISINVGKTPFILPPAIKPRPVRDQSWAPPVWSPMSNPMLPQMHGGPPAPNTIMNPSLTGGFAMDGVSMRHAAERVSTRFVPLQSFNGMQESSAWKNRISQRLQSRGVDPSIQNEMAERIAQFATQGDHIGSTKLIPYAEDDQPRGPLSVFVPGKLGAPGQMLQKAVARTRQSVARWGEDESSAQKPNGSSSSSRLGRIFCDNVLMDVLLERREKRENTYGLRVVPFRRLFFFVGLVMLFTLLINTAVQPLTVTSLKKIAFNAILSLIIKPSPETAGLADQVSFEQFDTVTKSVDPPLQAYVDLADIGFILLWVVFALFFISFVLEIGYSRLGKTLEIKRKGIRRARLVSFAHLPFLFIAVVIPSSADYVGISLGGIAGVVPLCAKDFDSLIFATASNLFGLAMGGLLAVQTMLVLLLVVPSVQRALAFVIAKEIFDLRKLSENSKAYLVGEKRLMIARFLWRNFPYMTPVLLYIPTILIAQLVSKVYASIMVYTFYILPLLSARLRRSKATRDQQPYKWIVFASFWTMLYFAPLGLIGLVEVSQLDQVTFITDLTLKNPIFYVTILAEVCLAIVVMSDVLYLFIASDDEADADRVIDRYMDVIEEEATINSSPFGQASQQTGVGYQQPPHLPRW